MKIIEKYRKLRDDRFVTDMITQSVYGTMQLEQQAVPMPDVEKAVRRARTEPIKTSETA
jgi:hypothetical protein